MVSVAVIALGRPIAPGVTQRGLCKTVAMRSNGFVMGAHMIGLRVGSPPIAQLGVGNPTSRGIEKGAIPSVLRDCTPIIDEHGNSGDKAFIALHRLEGCTAATLLERRSELIEAAIQSRRTCGVSFVSSPSFGRTWHRHGG